MQRHALPRRGRTARLATLAVAMLTLAACTSNSADTASTTLPPIGNGSGPQFGADTTEAPATTTTQPSPGASVDNLAPLGDPDFRFEVEMEGSVGAALPIGLVEIPRSDEATDPGRCLALLATYTGVRTKQLFVDQQAMPRSELVTDADPAEADATSNCDRTAVGNAGWAGRGYVRLLPGADLNVATVFFLAEGRTPRAIRLFGNEPDAQRFYQPATLEQLPDLPPVRPGAAPLNIAPPDPKGEAPDTFGDRFQETEATFRGVIPGIERIDGRPGTCVAVVGTVKPTRTVGAIMNQLSVPDIALVADGVALAPTPRQCDAGQLSSRGWYPLTQAGVANNNTFAFAQTFAANNDEPLLQAVVVGDLNDAKSRKLRSANLLDGIPRGPRREGINPLVPLRPVAEEVATPTGAQTASSVPPINEPLTGTTTTLPATTVGQTTTAPGDTAANAAPPTSAPDQTATETTPPTQPVYTVSGDSTITIVNEAVWHGHSYGLVGLPSDAEAATCFGILMTWSVSAGSPTDPPPVGLISSGGYWTPAPSEATCDPTALTNAGWQDANAANFNNAASSPVHVFLPIFLPAGQDAIAAIGVGNVADSVNVGYVNPKRLDAPPAIPGVVPKTTPPTPGSAAPTSTTTAG